MSIKILGGRARGFPLNIPKSETTRPTSVLVRRKLFDWRQHLDSYIFVDIFAGSGAMAFEALSRGAERILVNDSHRLAFKALQENSKRFKEAFQSEESCIKVTGLDALKWIDKELGFELPDTSEVILYLDPPYEDHAIYLQVIAALKEKGFAGELWLEADRLKGPKLEELSRAFKSVAKTIEQGDHFVLVGKVI
jgi:16S rRNA (guanine966-N2)-methyltransferase